MMACFLFLAARGLPPAGEGRLEHVLHHQGPHTHGQYVPVLPRCLLPHLRPGPAHSVERRVAGRKKTRLSNHFRDDISNPDHFTKTGSGQTQRESTQTKPKTAGVSLSVSFFLSSFLPFFLSSFLLAGVANCLARRGVVAALLCLRLPLPVQGGPTQLLAPPLPRCETIKQAVFAFLCAILRVSLEQTIV
jgi:hypothetical protein